MDTMGACRDCGKEIGKSILCDDCAEFMAFVHEKEEEAARRGEEVESGVGSRRGPDLKGPKNHGRKP